MAKKKKTKEKPKTNAETIKAIIEKEGMCSVLQMLEDYADTQANAADGEQCEAADKVAGWESVINSINALQDSLGDVNDC